MVSIDSEVEYIRELIESTSMLISTCCGCFLGGGLDWKVGGASGTRQALNTVLRSIVTR
jgi:hypothetical protein